MNSKKVAPVTGIRNQMQKIYHVLLADETLLRLLHYKDSPLSSAHPNITDSAQYWEIAMDVIRFAEKDSNLTDDAVCRIYLTTGRKRPVFGNTFVMRQNFEVNTIVHEDFMYDMRLEQIVDRVNHLLTHQPISGFGKIQHEGGDPYQAPRQFQTYLEYYSFLIKSRVTC